MGKINLIGTLGNLFVLPIVPIVMIYGFISTLLYNLFPRIGFIKIEEWLISYVYWVSKITAQFGVYMNVEGDRIKWMILCTAVIWLINKRMKNEK
ncbi:ComEC/Rec2 family competence protein [Patescibacteria group bacterium]|nr:ComEC/Rec2 family competence protein [Patescibacteria group bacterium]